MLFCETGQNVLSYFPVYCVLCVCVCVCVDVDIDMYMYIHNICIHILAKRPSEVFHIRELVLGFRV